MRSKQPPYGHSSLGFGLPFICPSSEFSFNKPEGCFTVCHSYMRTSPASAFSSLLSWLDAGKRTLPQGFCRVRLSPPENTRAHNFEAAHETVSLCPNKPEQSVTSVHLSRTFKLQNFYTWQIIKTAPKPIPQCSATQTVPLNSVDSQNLR